MGRKEAEELCKIYDGKKPKSLSLFLKLINLSEDKFYDIVKEHIVSPSKIWDKNQISKDTSNISPSDFDEWEKNSFKVFQNEILKSNSLFIIIPK